MAYPACGLITLWESQTVGNLLLLPRSATLSCFRVRRRTSAIHHFNEQPPSITYDRWHMDWNMEIWECVSAGWILLDCMCLEEFTINALPEPYLMLQRPRQMLDPCLSKLPDHFEFKCTIHEFVGLVSMQTHHTRPRSSHVGQSHTDCLYGIMMLVC